MDSELKKKWVAALRSGKYKQGRRELRNKEDCYCCLGVLCDIINPLAWEPIGLVGFRWSDPNEGTGTCLPPFSLSHLGLNASAFDLIEMNDAQGKSFNEIADEIEKTA